MKKTIDVSALVAKYTRLYSAPLKETLLHEMIHIKLGPKKGPARAFGPSGGLW